MYYYRVYFSEKKKKNSRWKCHHSCRLTLTCYFNISSVCIFVQAYVQVFFSLSFRCGFGFLLSSCCFFLCVFSFFLFCPCLVCLLRGFRRDTHTYTLSGSDGSHLRPVRVVVLLHKHIASV